MAKTQIVITWDPETEQLEVESPLMGNKVLMYGLLGTARDVVTEVHAKAKAGRIVPAAFGIAKSQ